MLRKSLLLLTISVALTLSSIDSSSLSDMVMMPAGGLVDSLVPAARADFGGASRLIGRGYEFIRNATNTIVIDSDDLDVGEDGHADSGAAPAKRHDPDRDRNVTEVIRSRGFQAEEHDVTTRDGYILTIQRIINPLVKPEFRAKMKPVIMQHGLMSSSVDFVINSVDVRPEEWPKASSSPSEAVREEEGDEEDDSENALHDTQEHPNALGFYLANRGYDVWLTNSRGNYYGMRHTNISTLNPKFWSFTFDEQIKFDLPDTIEFILELTNKTKLGYVGHSQGTLMMFGLLSDRPHFAEVVEPIVALAPVAYVNNCLSPVKYFSFLTPYMQHINSPFAPPNFIIKYLGPIVCGPKFIKEEVCANIVFLSCGFDWEELDMDRADAYLGHMPSGTSLKNIVHYGQMVNSGRFAHFDYGPQGNKARYNSSRAPDYNLTRIWSDSIALFIASNDWLASPKDVARLIADLNVKPTVYNITELKPKWNHIDFVYAKHAGEIVNTRIEQVFKAYD